MWKNKRLWAIAIVLAAVPWVVERCYTFAQISLPYHCESQYSFRYVHPEGKGSVASKGSMQLSYYQGGNGVGTYIGHLTYLDREGNVEKELSVHRAIEFDYVFKPGLLKTTTINSTHIQGDEISDNDAEKYVFPGFKLGQITYGVMVKIIGGGFAAGSSNFPRAVCAKMD